VTTALVVLLFVNVAWNLVVWPQFVKRVVRDPRARDADGRRTTFFRVHAILFAITGVITAATLVVAIAGLVA
jgi:hypothetical protein